MTTPTSALPRWVRPNEVMALHKLKQKKKALQARFSLPSSSSGSQSKQPLDVTPTSGNETIKRRNPFICNEDNKRQKLNDRKLNFTDFDASADATLFKLLNVSEDGRLKDSTAQHISFTNILNQLEESPSPLVKPTTCGETWIPIDWALKSKVRFLSSKPFAWNRILKTSEEASGITGFVRCIDTNSISTTLDTSPNARFHQCCLYWQQPNLPWLKLFPRTTGRASETGTSVATAPAIRNSLQSAWSDSLRSLFQLLRARQCPYFYVCANTFTILFRAAGVCGCTEIQALITPTTRGFRQVLRQEDIEFSMPLKTRLSEQGCETSREDSDRNDTNDDDDEDEVPDEEWLSSMGVNAEDIKKINYVQERKRLKVESAVDNSTQSLVCVEGVDVQALYNFLINCKSTTATTGPLAGIPPTLLAPVAFNGAALKALQVRESRVNVDNVDYYSLELSNGPILPHTIHNLCSLHPADNNLTATFANIRGTVCFTKVRARLGSADSNEGPVPEQVKSPCLKGGSVVFGQENLSDCGLSKTVLKHFCSDQLNRIQNFECLKYDGSTKTYTWS